MAPPKNTEQAIPMEDKANKAVLDFANKEEAEADRIFYEHQGLQADGKTPLDEDPAEKPIEEAAKPAEEEAKPLEEKKGEKEAEAKPSEDDDLTKDLTVDNADKRIGAAQKKMHDSNKRAKDAETAQAATAKENEDLRRMIDQQAVAPAAADTVVKDVVKEVKPQSDEEIDADLIKLREEYPEIAEPMIKMMQKQNAENVSLRERLDKQDEREVEREKDAKVATENRHYNSISEVHSDFDEISQEPLLDDWIDALPPMEKAGAIAIRKDGSTNEVIALITNFKKANGYKVPGTTDKKDNQKKADSKLDRAKGMSVPEFNKSKEANLQDGQIRFTQEQIAAMTEAEWKENEPAIDEAMRLGLVR